MALGQQSGGDNEARVAEAKRIVVDMGLVSRTDEMSPKEQQFVEQMFEAVESVAYDGTPFISGKQLFWLRDLKDKYCI